MLANTLTLTVNAIAYVLVRVSESNGTSVYRLRDDTKEVKLTLRNQEEKVSAKKAISAMPIYRTNAFLEWTVFATVDAAETYFSYSASMRYRRGSAPSFLKLMSTGAQTLIAAQQSDLIDGQV